MYLTPTLCTFLFLVIPTSECVRILGVAPIPSYSHQVVFRPIWNELSRRGHDVVVITTDPQNNPDLNLTEIDISFIYELWTTRDVIGLMHYYENYSLMRMIVLDEIMNELCYQELSHPEIQKLIRNETEHFDLVIVEFLLPYMYGFAERFKAPFIGVLSFDLPIMFHLLLENPTHPVAYPDLHFLGYAGELNFWERLNSAITTILMKVVLFYRDFFSNYDVNSMMEEKFGFELPSSNVMTKNVSMVLVNENPTFYGRPLGPAFVLFGGGIHLRPQKPLPQDLQDYLDGAEEGFIYFSLGTNVKSDIFVPEMRKIVLDAFRELPYRVLWKFDVTDIPDVPENVKISTWLPQQDILRHPKIKVFITQGGLQSTEEAIFSHVPIVGIPFIADQIGNVKKIVAKGGGVFLDKKYLTKESLKAALLEVINNPKYKESLVKIAELSRDQPMTGLEKAVWWTEYVIRHKGAPHFRNPAMDIPLYQYYFLDIIAFLLGVLYIVYYTFRKIPVLFKQLKGVVTNKCRTKRRKNKKKTQ